MLYLKTFENFQDGLESIAESFLNDFEKQYDLRLGKSFDREKANCAWFTNEFIDWANDKGYDFKVAYFPADEESHTAPIKDGQIIDFTIKQFTKDPTDDYAINTPEDYKQYGYETYEIIDEVPEWFTIRNADIISEGYNKPRKGMKRRWSVKYKKSIDCSNPKGFSQINYCKRKRRGGKYKS